MGGEGPEGSLSWDDPEGNRGGVSVMGSARRGPRWELGGPGCRGDSQGFEGSLLWGLVLRGGWGPCPEGTLGH